MDKGRFLKKTGLVGLGGILSLDSHGKIFRGVSLVSSGELAVDEDFWATIRKGYRLQPDFINLENGYYNFISEQVLGKYIEHIREVNYLGS